MRKTGRQPRPIPETEEGPAAFERFRELTQRLVNASKRSVREDQDSEPRETP